MNDGGPAFPGLAYTSGYGCSKPIPMPSGDTVWSEYTQGMTRRAYYKAKIIAGFCANPSIFAHNDRCGWSLVNCSDNDLVGYASRLASLMVEEDDAMLVALEKKAE